MLAKILCCSSLLLVMSAALAAEPSDEADGQRQLGMSVVGSDEAPKSLFIVPWKSSELGDGLDLARLLDDMARPVDREVFMRELAYYRIRSE